MKTTLQKLTCLTLVLSLLLTASNAMAASINSTTINMLSSEWEENFLMMVSLTEETYGFKMADSSAFSVTEFPALDGTVGYEHSLGIAGFMKVSYYDYGDGLFNSAVLTINLDHDDALVEMAMLTIFYTILAGDLDTTEEEYEALVEAMCPIFNEVFSGQEHINGSQAATLRGVGYAMEANDNERFIKLYTNVSLTQNDE